MAQGIQSQTAEQAGRIIAEFGGSPGVCKFMECEGNQ
jgi:hypothetical protein